MTHVFACPPAERPSWLDQMPTEVMERLEDALTTMRVPDDAPEAEYRRKNVAVLRDVLRMELAERRVAAWEARQM